MQPAEHREYVHHSLIASDGADAKVDADPGDGALVAAAQANPQAFAALYRRYLARVYHFVRAQVHNSEDANDLTQQVFLQALDALPRYQMRGLPFAAWLFRIARNDVIDRYRKQRYLLPWEALPETLHPFDTQDAHDPEAALLQQEALARLRQLVQALDVEKRELLALRFAGQLSSSEIAAVVGKSPEAVKKQLTRTIQALKEQYHDL